MKRMKILMPVASFTGRSLGSFCGLDSRADLINLAAQQVRLL